MGSKTIKELGDITKGVAAPLLQLTLEDKVARAITKLEIEIATTKNWKVRLRDTIYLTMLKTAGPELIARLINQIDRI